MSFEWVHCNKCMSRPSANVRLALASCGHVVCKACTNGSTDSCPICLMKCAFVVLVLPLPPPIVIYFQDPISVAQKLAQIYQFQESNRLRIFESIYTKAHDHLTQLDNRIEALKIERQCLEQEILQASNNH